MSVNVHINSQPGEDESINVQVNVPAYFYATLKSIAASVDAGKTLLKEFKKFKKPEV